MKAMSKRQRRKAIRRLERFERAYAQELERAQKRADWYARLVRQMTYERDALADKLREMISPIEVARTQERALDKHTRLVAPVHIGPDGYWTVG